MKKSEIIIGHCPDCGKDDVNIVKSYGICEKCKIRKQNSKARGREYIPYIELPEERRKKIDDMREAQSKIITHKKKNIEIKKEEEPEFTVPKISTENYYQMKAEQKPEAYSVEQVEKPIITNAFNPLEDENSFITTLRECGCDIPANSLKEVLAVLMNTDKLKDIFMTIAKSTSQQSILDLEQALNVVERKLQHDWEYNGFQEIDDIKFKGFLTWRRVLKGSIFFWKKLYQTNALIEMQRAWNAYTADPNDKILLAGDSINSRQKRFQITTESISTIFNTRRPFTRVFFAETAEEAHELLIKWMADRQLHEDRSKTVIVELSGDGIDGRKEERK